MKKPIQLALFLALTAALAGGLLSVVNDLTKDKIEAANISKELIYLEEIFPNGEFIKKSEEIADEDGILDLFEVVDQGYVYKLISSGYGGDITYLVGFDKEVNIVGIEIITHSETPGFGDVIETDKYKEMLVDKSALGQLDTVSGATVSSVAINKGINIAASHLSGEDIVMEDPQPTLGDKILISDEKIEKYTATIVEKEEVDNKVIYTVSVEGYGLLDAQYPNPDYKENIFKITVIDNAIAEIEMTQFGDTIGFGDNVDNTNYYKLFEGVDSIDSEVDTISNATRTSYSLISAVKKVLEDN